MKLRKIVSLAAAVILAFAVVSVNAAAEAGPCSIIAGERCHCGGERYETRTEEYTHKPCPVDGHGASCADYYLVTEKLYHGCTNPACTDTWTEVEKTYNAHWSHLGWLNL